MKLSDIKLMFLRDNNTQGILVLNKIQQISNTYNITYNKAITYLLANCENLYQKKILNICQAIYPYDGQLDINIFTKNQKKINEQLEINIYNSVDFLTSDERVKHPEDHMLKNTNINNNQQKIKDNYNLIDNNNNMTIETIIPNKKIIKKRKIKKLLKKEK